MLKILQGRLQRCVNHELPDVQAGFRKGRGNRDQIANICSIIEKAKEFWKISVFIPSQKKSMAKNAQTTTQLHSSHMLAK